MMNRNMVLCLLASVVALCGAHFVASGNTSNALELRGGDFTNHECVTGGRRCSDCSNDSHGGSLNCSSPKILCDCIPHNGETCQYKADQDCGTRWKWNLPDCQGTPISSGTCIGAHCTGGASAMCF